MEKNWIEKIKEAVRVSMNRGLKTSYDYDSNNNQIIINLADNSYIRNDESIKFFITKDKIILNTFKGENIINHSLTDRERLEIQGLMLSIKEYKEDMAISELDEFISDKKEEITDINDLDNEDD